MNSETIIIAADKWMPVNGEPDDELPGYAIEIAEKIFTDAGYDFEYVVVPWKRAIERVQSGFYSAVIGATTQNAEDLFLPDSPLGFLENDYYTLKASKWVYTSPESLEGEILGIISGYNYGNIQDYINTSNYSKEGVQTVSSTDSITQNLRKLLLGRITVIVDWSPIIDYTAFENRWDDEIRFAGRGGNRNPFFIGFNPELKHLGKFWDVKFQQMLNDGSLETILLKYNLELEDIGLK